MASQRRSNTAEETVSLFTHLQCEPPTLRINQNWCPPGKNTESSKYSHVEITAITNWQDFTGPTIMSHFGNLLDKPKIVPRLPSTTPREIDSELELAYVFFETVHNLVRRGLRCGFEDLKADGLLDNQRTPVYLGGCGNLKSNTKGLPDLLFWSEKTKNYRRCCLPETSSYLINGRPVGETAATRHARSNSTKPSPRSITTWSKTRLGMDSF
ncbi:uncharacterized protein N7496_010008 [Penicillium cataractarum]|uniref:Uncharacterized protein n=1 Tax=Penicillium cataractarum TaxID=2100454 RepID=A0A9W9RQ21_9EURO|nr:uncharacterized protein N7496_010008 [Penicillium cataractarum]KAJ5364295.1 hypothetical protein N7496_010008 [Penicillium cataractarum]